MIIARSRGRFDALDAVAVRVAAEQRRAAGTAVGECDALRLQALRQPAQIVDQHGDVAIAADVDRAGTVMGRRRQLQKMELLIAELQPGARIAEIGAGDFTQTERFAVERARPRRVGDDHADMMQLQYRQDGARARPGEPERKGKTTVLRMQTMAHLSTEGRRDRARRHACALFRGHTPDYNEPMPTPRSPTRSYRVTAFYERPELERNAVVEAESVEQAMVKALLERKVPAGFTRDESGWIAPVFWHADMGGKTRWPRLIAADCIAWGEGSEQGTLRFSVEEGR